MFVTRLQKLKGVNYPSLDDVHSCRLHSETKIKFFCHDCCELVCHDCCLIDHKEHKVETIAKELLESHNEVMRSIAATFVETAKELEAMLQQGVCKREEFATHVSEIRDKIVTNLEELEKQIQLRKKELLGQLKKLEKDPLEKIESHEKILKNVHKHFTDSKIYMDSVLSHSSPTGVLSVERSLVENNTALCAAFQNIPMIEETPQFEFISGDQLVQSVSNYGKLQTVSTDNPQSIEYFSLPRLSLPNILYSSQSSLASSTSDITSSTEESQLLNSIPLSVSVPMIQGDPVRTIDGIDRPSGITSANFLIVCEYGSKHCVSIFTHQGFLVRKIGEKIEENRLQDGKFLHPRCVAVDSSEQVFVTDSLYRFQVFDSNGLWLKTVGSRGKDELQFRDPVGIAIGTNRRVFVCERENYRIQVLNSDLSHYKFIGQRGRGQGEFNQPTDIAIDVHGLLYVVDSFNHRIQVLTQEGLFVREFGTKGKQRGQLLLPSNICVDPDGFVFVTELRNNRISMFTVRGEFVKCFGEKGNGLGQLHSPRGVAVDLNKVLYVSDYGNNRVHVFK